MREFQIQTPQKLNIWCGILDDDIIERYFIYGKLNGESYLQLLREAVDPEIIPILENGDNISKGQHSIREV